MNPLSVVKYRPFYVAFAVTRPRSCILPRYSVIICCITCLESCCKNGFGLPTTICRTPQLHLHFRKLYYFLPQLAERCPVAARVPFLAALCGTPAAHLWVTDGVVLRCRACSCRCCVSRRPPPRSQFITRSGTRLDVALWNAHVATVSAAAAA